MAMWAQRRELATKFLFWPWCFITCICSQNEERKLTPQRKSVTSDDTQMYLDWCLDFSSFSTRHWFIVILRLESLREGVRNCSFLLHSNQNLPVAREAQWREWKDKVLAGTHPPQAILPLLLYPTGDCARSRDELRLQLRAGSCCQASFGEDAECHHFPANCSLKAFCWATFLSHKHILQFRPGALAATKQKRSTHAGRQGRINDWSGPCCVNTFR